METRLLMLEEKPVGTLIPLSNLRKAVLSSCVRLQAAPGISTLPF